MFEFEVAVKAFFGEAGTHEDLQEQLGALAVGIAGADPSPAATLQYLPNNPIRFPERLHYTAMSADLVSRVRLATASWALDWAAQANNWSSVHLDDTSKQQAIAVVGQRIADLEHAQAEAARLKADRGERDADPTAWTAAGWGSAYPTGYGSASSYRRGDAADEGDRAAAIARDVADRSGLPDAKPIGEVGDPADAILRRGRTRGGRRRRRHWRSRLVRPPAAAIGQRRSCQTHGDAGPRRPLISG